MTVPGVSMALGQVTKFGWYWDRFCCRSITFFLQQEYNCFKWMLWHFGEYAFISTICGGSCLGGGLILSCMMSCTSTAATLNGMQICSVPFIYFSCPESSRQMTEGICKLSGIFRCQSKRLFLQSRKMKSVTVALAASRMPRKDGNPFLISNLAVIQYHTISNKGLLHDFSFWMRFQLLRYWPANVKPACALVWDEVINVCGSINWCADISCLLPFVASAQHLVLSQFGCACFCRPSEKLACISSSVSECGRVKAACWAHTPLKSVDLIQVNLSLPLAFFSTRSVSPQIRYTCLLLQQRNICPFLLERATIRINVSFLDSCMS